MVEDRFMLVDKDLCELLDIIEEMKDAYRSACCEYGVFPNALDKLDAWKKARGIE